MSIVNTFTVTPVSKTLKGESCWPWTMLTFFQTSNEIHLSPKHNQSPCTETHLSLRVDSLPSPDQNSPLRDTESMLPQWKRSHSTFNFSEKHTFGNIGLWIEISMIFMWVGMCVLLPLYRLHNICSFKSTFGYSSIPFNHNCNSHLQYNFFFSNQQSNCLVVEIQKKQNSHEIVSLELNNIWFGGLSF